LGTSGGKRAFALSIWECDQRLFKAVAALLALIAGPSPANCLAHAKEAHEQEKVIRSPSQHTPRELQAQWWEIVPQVFKVRPAQ